MAGGVKHKQKGEFERAVRRHSQCTFHPHFICFLSFFLAVVFWLLRLWFGNLLKLLSVNEHCNLTSCVSFLLINDVLAVPPFDLKETLLSTLSQFFFSDLKELFHNF